MSYKDKPLFNETTIFHQLDVWVNQTAEEYINQFTKSREEVGQIKKIYKKLEEQLIQQPSQ